MTFITPRLKNTIGWCFVCIPPIVYYLYLAQFSLDVPNGDDFVVIMHYLLKSDATTSWQTKWNELTYEFIEHRLVFTRVVAQFIRALFGHLDLRWVMLTGNLSLLGVTVLLYRLLRANGLSSWYLLPITLCLFQPIAYESHFWAISSTNYMPVCLFAMLSFYGISRNDRPGLAGAWLSAFIATYTFANGLVVWPIGALVLALNRRRKPAVIWLTSTVVIVSMFYYNHTYQAHPSMAENLRERLPMVIANFFLLLGAAFNSQDTWHTINPGDAPACIAGVLIAVISLGSCFILAFETQFPARLNAFARLIQTRHQAFLWAAILFIVLSCAAFAVGRTSDGSVATDSRYRDFPVFAMSLAYCVILLALSPFQKRLWAVGATVASLFFCLSSYAVYTPRLMAQNARYIAGAYNWHHNRNWLIYHETDYFSQVANFLSGKLEHEGADWYRIRNYFAEPPTLSAKKLPLPTTMDLEEEIAFWRLPFDPIGPHEPYFWLQFGTQSYLLPVKRQTSLSNWVRTGHSLGNSFSVDFSYGRALFPGRYTVSFYLPAVNQRLLFSPNLVLTSHPHIALTAR